MALTTEERNSATESLDQIGTLELVRLINSEDAKVNDAVAECADAIAAAIDTIAAQLKAGGRLIYVGAGTSGRLGVLDASECPPTFNTDPGQVLGLIAGGDKALRYAVEGAEDSLSQGATDLRAASLTHLDIVAGIAASGGTPFVIGALQYAREIGAKTIAVTCNENSDISALADIDIAVVVGPEVLAGSTRLKAGTATKRVLNLLTTGTMVRLGKTYGNLMVDLRASNEKLKRRAVEIVRAITGLSATDAARRLERCGGEVKTAVVCQQRNLTPADARAALVRNGGRLRDTLENER